MRISTSRRRHHPGDLIAGFLALIALVLGLGAVPYGLWWIGGWPWPTRLPDMDEINTALTSPDDGSLFVAALLIAGWLGWATFAVAVIVEIPATVRGIRAPRLPALSVQQRLAAVLVSAVAGMLTFGPVATAEPTMAAETTLATLDEWRPVPTVPADEPNDEEARPDTPASDDGDQATPNKPYDDASDERQYLVEPGDTLWDIASEHLGDATRWPEIAEASANTVQPDGQRLIDPDLIYPGWTLTLPAPESDRESVPDTGRAEGPNGDHGTTDDAQTSSSASEEPADPSTDADGAGEDADHRSPAAGHPWQGHPALDDRTRNAQSGGDEGDDWDDTQVAPRTAGDTDANGTELVDIVRTSAGMGSLLAAGLIGLLTARRALQQRHRRAGQRLSAPSDQATAAETELRHVADPLSVEFVDRALRALAHQYADRDQPLPSVCAARLAPDQLELHLAAGAQAPVPWVSTDDGRIWMLTADSVSQLDAGVRDWWPAPYPSLVTIGHDADDAHVMVNLEHARTLSTVGAQAATGAFMSALAADLATSRFADDVQVTVIGDGVELDALQTGRVRRVQARVVDDFLRALSAQARADRELMARNGVRSLAHARTMQTIDVAWTPEIILVDTALHDEQWNALTRVIEKEPRLAIAAVTHNAGRASEWTLQIESADEAVLEPLGMTIRPQQMSRTTSAHVVDLITSASGTPAGPSRPELRLDEIPPTAVQTAEKTASETEQSGDGDLSSATSVAQPTGTADGSPPPGERRESSIQHPRILLLSEPDVVGARGPLDPAKRGQAVQVAAYLSLRPGRSSSAMDEAIWPGRRQAPATRAVAVSTLRRWLGTHPLGEAYLPHHAHTYALHPDVRSDWDDWRDLLASGPQAATTDDLQRALDLVRARPLSGVRSGSYAWADMHAQEMIAEIVDACHELAERALRAGDFRAAQAAALRGLDIEPGCELLWRDRIKTEARLSTRTRVLALIARLRDIADELGGDLEDETIELIHQLESPNAGRTVED